MLETLFVLAIGAVLLGIAGPRLLGTSTKVALTNARAEVTSAVSLAQAAAARYGRVSYLIVDVVRDRLEIQADTSVMGGQTPVPLRSVDLWSELGVDVSSTQPMVCFDPRGISVPVGACPGTGVVLRLERAGVRDSVVISSTGRVSPS